MLENQNDTTRAPRATGEGHAVSPGTRVGTAPAAPPLSRLLPDCMMPDGAEPCRSFLEMQERLSRLEAFVRKNFTQIEPLNSVVGYRDKASRASYASRLRREALDALGNGV